LSADVVLPDAGVVSEVVVVLVDVSALVFCHCMRKLQAGGKSEKSWFDWQNGKILGI
jgi:hypothetical protein